MINLRWVYDTILIDFSSRESYWELCPKTNHLMIVLIINIYELINNKSYLAFFITKLHLLMNSYIVMKFLGLL